MGRWVIFILSFVLLVIVSFTSYLYIYRADFLSLALTRALETKVHLKAVTLSRHGLYIKSLQIENPPGSKVKKGFSAHDVKIKMRYLELLKAITGVMSNKITIDAIVIEKPTLRMEIYDLNGADNSLKRLIERSAAQNDSLSSRMFMVKKVVITKVQLEVQHHNLPYGSLRPSPIAKFEIKNIGKKQPVSTKELLHTIAKGLLVEAEKELQPKKTK